MYVRVENKRVRRILSQEENERNGAYFPSVAMGNLSSLGTQV
jgi:hypothetical protein